VKKWNLKKSKVFEVPGSTFKNNVNSNETDVEKMINTRLGGKPVLTHKLEELVCYCLMMELNILG
jgi:hypothetical protein